jgi:small subunit ribosomal protein S17
MNQIERTARKTKKGIVVSNKMQKTLVVEVESLMQHSRYPKTIKRSRKYYAHTEQSYQIGDSVVIVETRPLSKLKRWRVVE